MRAKRTDGNHSKILTQIRKLGMTAHSTHTVGDGFPDIVAGYRGQNYLFEVKDPDQPPSKRKLTPDEVKFHDTWMGRVYVVETIEQIVKIIDDEKRLRP